MLTYPVVLGVFNFVLSLHLQLNFLYASSKGSGKSEHSADLPGPSLLDGALWTGYMDLTLIKKNNPNIVFPSELSCLSALRTYSKTCVKRLLKNRQNKDLDDK